MHSFFIGRTWSVALQCLGINSAEKGWSGWAAEDKLVQDTSKVISLIHDLRSV